MPNVKHHMQKALTFAIVAAIAIVSYQYLTSVHAQAEPFDSRKWQERQDLSQQNDPGCVRGGMALTLIQSRALTNRSRGEVFKQLGEADFQLENQLRYHLGQCHWDWQHSALVITFNAMGLVTSATIQKE